MRNTQAKMSPVQTNPCYKMCFITKMSDDSCIWCHAPVTELSKSLSCLSDNRSGRCGQCVRPIKYLPDLHFIYNFN